MGLFAIIAAIVAFTAAMTIEPIRDFLFGDMDGDDQFARGRAATITKRGSLEHIPVIYGQRRTGGIINFKGVEGTSNEYLWIEFILSEGECDSLVDMYIDGESYTESKYSGLVTVTFYPGTDSQTADSGLVAAFEDYTSNDRGRGLCKAVVKLRFNETHLTREPKIEFEIKGKKILDTRDSSTAFSSNPALVLYDYLVNDRYGAGYKIDSSQLVAADFNAAANYCETQITEHLSTSDTTDYYQINGLIDTEKSVRENVIEILNAFHAHLVPEGDLYRLMIEKDESAEVTLDHDNIVEDSVTYAFNDVKDRFNEIILDYPNKEKKYLDDQIIINDATLLAQDNSIKAQKRIKNYLDTNSYRMTHFAKIVMKKSRQGIAVGLTANESAFEILPGTIVNLSLEEPGWLNKKFRVLRVKELSGGNVGLNLLEHEPTVYDRSVPVFAPTPPDTYLPDPFTVAQLGIPSAASGEAHVVLSSSGDFVARVLVTWTPIDNVYITHYEIRWRINGDTEWLAATPAIGKDANRQYIIGPDDGDVLDIQVRAINARGVAGEWSPTLNHSVVGTLGLPPDVSIFQVLNQADGTRYAEFSITSPPVDLAGYKIRYSSSLTETWDDMIELHEGLIPFSPYEFNLLDEGDWLFAIKAYDRGGRESENALYVNTTLPAPRLGSILYTESMRGLNWPGTKTDCWRDESDNSLVGTSTTQWDDLTDTWDDYDEHWYFDTATSFDYEHPRIDLGAKLSFLPSVSVTVAYGSTYTVYESHSDDDVTYSSFAAISGLIEARFIKFKVTVNNSTSPPKLTNANIFLGGDSVVDNFRLLDTSGLSVEAGGGVRIPIRSTFQQIVDVNISMQSVGSGATWELIDLDESSGPHIKMYNSSGTLIYPTITAQVTGV